MRKACLGILVLLLCAGCAYNFVGFTSRNIRSIAIPVFENKTVKYEIETELTKSVIDAFVQDNRLKVLDKNSAESILLGEILQYKRTTNSYDDAGDVKDYKLEFMVKLTYKDKMDKVILTKEITDWDTYLSSESEEIGITKLCNKFALNIVNIVLE